MAAPSRTMPPFDRSVRLVSWLRLALVFGVICSPGIFVPTLLVGPGLMLLLMVGLGLALGPRCKRQDAERRRRLTRERAGESICTFARSFERRATDPWVIRAVYEWFTPACEFPVRASDQLELDLWHDDLAVHESFLCIVRRCGRSAQQTKRNPYYDKVTTVRDLVLFVNAQPRIAAS